MKHAGIGFTPILYIGGGFLLVIGLRAGYDSFTLGGILSLFLAILFIVLMIAVKFKREKEFRKSVHSPHNSPTKLVRNSMNGTRPKREIIGWLMLGFGLVLPVVAWLIFYDAELNTYRGMVPMFISVVLTAISLFVLVIGLEVLLIEELESSQPPDEPGEEES